MNLFNKQIQIPILPTNPEVLSNIRQQQYHQELTPPDNGNYIPLTTCLFEIILNGYSNQLLPRDILFFVQILILYQSALSKNQKSIIYSSEKLAKLLGYKAKEKSNMRSIVLRRIKKLEKSGLLDVTRNKNKKGSDEVNEIVPLLPDNIYKKIKYESFNFNVNDTKLANESNIQHILRTKLFVPVDLECIKSLLKDSMPHTYKRFILNCIITAYKNNHTTGELSFSATAKELMSKNNISRRTLFNILHFIKNQYPNYLIEVEHSYRKSDDIDSNKYDKSTFDIYINPMIIPQSFLQKNIITVKKETAEKNITDRLLYKENETIKTNTYDGSEVGVQIWKPGSANLESHNNKAIIINKSNKNTDVKNKELAEFLQTSNSHYLESSSSELSSKSLKNSIKDFMDALPTPTSKTIKNISEKKNKINKILKKTTPNTKARDVGSNKLKDFNPNRTLKDYYPLTKEEVNHINWYSRREFSTNYGNQLMLKLIAKKAKTNSKYPTKKHMTNYMIQVFRKDLNDPNIVNNINFRFKCNIESNNRNNNRLESDIEHHKIINVLDIQKAERYLSSIENSYDTSYEMQLKRKIAGLFKNVKAYQIILNSNFSYLEGLFKLNFFKKLELSQLQQDILKRAIKSVYGNKVDVQITVVTNNKTKSKNTSHKFLEAGCNDLQYQTKSQDLGEKPKPCSKKYKQLMMDTNTAWHGIRKDLIAEFGKDIDSIWFAKAVVKESMPNSTLTLTMPNKFMADSIKNKYGYAISRIAGVFGFKYMEYNY